MLTLMTQQLIFIDGMGERLATYQRLSELVDFPDSKLISYGELGDPGSPFSIEEAARTLGDHLNAVGVDEVVLVGTSIGAKIALEYATTHDNVLGLVLVGVQEDADKDALIKRLRALRFVPSKMLPLPSGFDKDGFRGILTAAYHYSANTALPKLTIPTTLLYGAKDDARSAEIEKIVGGLPDGQVHVVDGDHFLANDNPAELAKAVQAMIQKTGLSSDQ